MSSPDGWVQILVLAVLLVVSLSVPVAAHGNYLAVDSQVSGEGTVQIEAAFLVTDGYVVLHADDAGQIGEVIGHVTAETNVFHGDLSVTMDESYWANVTGSTTVWAVLHYDADGDGEFHPADDPPIGGPEAPDQAVRFAVQRGEQSAFVLADREHAQKTNTSEVIVRRAQLPDDGYLVIRSNEDGTPGDVIGHRSLSAGVHENVTVSIDDHAYHHRPEQFSLWTVVYRSDGDSTFDDGDDPVAVNGSLVASQFQVERTGEVEAGHDHTESPAGTATETDHEHQHEHGEASETATSADSRMDPTSSRLTPISTTSPGLGTVTTVLAGVLLLLASRWQAN